MCIASDLILVLAPDCTFYCAFPCTIDLSLWLMHLASIFIYLSRFKGLGIDDFLTN